MTEERSERGPDDPRDKRDVRLPDEPRDERDERREDDPRDPRDPPRVQDVTDIQMGETKRKHSFWITIGASLLVLLALLLAGYSITSSSSKTCEAGNESRKAIVGVFQLMEKVVNESQTGEVRTAEEIIRTQRFFNDVYAQLKPRDC